MEDHDTALRYLRDLISSGALGASGKLMPERTLANDLNISRRAVRRALDILEAEGVLKRRQGHGTFIADAPKPIAAEPLTGLRALNNPIDIIEVRLALEPTLCRLAALRAPENEAWKFLEYAEATRIAATPEQYEAADAAFHLSIAVAARNPVFLALFEAIMAVVKQATWRQGRETGHCVNNQAIYAECHRQIAEAIAQRNGALAEERMRSHLSRVQHQLLGMMYPMLAAS